MLCDVLSVTYDSNQLGEEPASHVQWTETVETIGNLGDQIFYNGMQISCYEFKKGGLGYPVMTICIF